MSTKAIGNDDVPTTPDKPEQPKPSEDDGQDQ